MPARPLDLSRARVLISNDDGIHAPGLRVLERVVRRLAKEVWVVAPEHEQSAASHSLTLRRPLRIRKLSGRRYAVDGTPTDSVLLAVREIMKDRAPDLVLSGINRGGNLGEDVTYSGTIAAAMEGALLGIPAIALSQLSENGRPVKWGTAEHHLADVLERLTSAPWPPGILMNGQLPRTFPRARHGASRSPARADARSGARSSRAAIRGVSPTTGSGPSAPGTAPGPAPILAPSAKAPSRSRP